MFPRSNLWSLAAAGVRSAATSLIVALFVITFLLQAFEIPSASMENTLKIGDYVLVDKSVYGTDASPLALLPYHDVQRGDVIVFHYPLQPATYFVKRVVGVPGDRIRIDDKQLYVNGLPVLDGYSIHSDARHDHYRDDFPELQWAPANVDARWWVEMHARLDAQGELVVPQGRYFVLGDNRDNSQDSRYWGFVPRANIIGRPLVIYWSRNEGPDAGLPAARGDTLSGLALAVSRIHRGTRWDRILRIVR